MHPTPVGQEFVRGLTRELAHRAAPVVFSRAESELHQSEIFAQRYETIKSRGWSALSEFPEQIERDEFDDDAIHIQGRFDQKLVASARIVFPVAGRPLPVEVSHGVKLEPFGEYAEIGRTIVNTSTTQLSRKYLFVAMVGCALDEILGASYFRVAAAANRPMLRLYRRLGIPVDTVGPPTQVYAEERFPVTFDLLCSVRTLSQILRK